MKNKNIPETREEIQKLLDDKLESREDIIYPEGSGLVSFVKSVFSGLKRLIFKEVDDE